MCRSNFLIKMKSSIFYSLLLVLGAHVRSAQAQILIPNDGFHLRDDLSENDFSGKINLGNGPVDFEVKYTDKGNGYLELGGIQLNIFDIHDDGQLILGGHAIVRVLDVDGDGLSEILVCGVLENTSGVEEQRFSSFGSLVYYDYNTKKARVKQLPQ